MDKTKVMLALIVATIFLISIAGCQLPQYQPENLADETGEEDEVNELTEELEKLTSEIEGEETEEVSDAVEMTEEEKAKEDFKKKLLEKQAEAAAETTAEEAVVEEETTEEETPVEAVAEEETAEETVEAPVEEVAVPAASKVLKATEGDLVELRLKGNDPDGDALTYTFTEPLDDEGKWQTAEGDAGSYKVTVSVSDGKVTVKDTVKIVIEPLNRVPVIEPIADMTVDEGQTVTLAVEASDPDGETLTFSYSGWMTSPTKKTGYSDAGTHTVTVTVSDGVKEASETVSITVNDKNRPPELTITW